MAMITVTKPRRRVGGVGIEAFGVGGWEWLNPPAEWALDQGGLRVRAGARTDFWRTTHYGYDRDSGHVFGRWLEGDFRLSTTFAGEYAAQYDQAGACCWVDGANWVKAGVELVDGAWQLSTVVTRDFSDWSVLGLGRPAGSVSLDVRRTGDTVTVAYGLDGAAPETMVRLAYLPPGRPVLAGVMCAAPDGPGFEARFSALEITPL